MPKPKPIAAYKLYVFDWDGTLNSIRLPLRIKDTVKRMLTDHKYRNPESFVHRHTTFDTNLWIKHEENSILTAIADVLLSLSRPKLHNDSIETVHYLEKRHKKLAIFTNAGSRRVSRETQATGIMNYFDVIASARAIKAEKPSPAGLKMILETLNVKPQDAIMIGDSIDDIIAAKLAGTASCGIADGFDSNYRLQSAKPDYMFNSIEALRRSLIKQSSH